MKTKAEIKRWMQRELSYYRSIGDEHYDDCGELKYTLLAENAFAALQPDDVDIPEEYFEASAELDTYYERLMK